MILICNTSYTKLTVWADGADGRERGDGAGRARTLASSCSPVLLPAFSSRLYPSNNEILHQSITHDSPSPPSIYLRDLCNSAHRIKPSDQNKLALDTAFF